MSDFDGVGPGDLLTYDELVQLYPDVAKKFESQLEACRKERDQFKAEYEKLEKDFDDVWNSRDQIIRERGEIRFKLTLALEALEKFDSEDFYWAKKPFRDESGKEQPGYIKKVATLREFARGELIKIRGRE